MIRIVATKVPFRKLYEVPCRFYAANFTRFVPSTFYLDPGSDTTTIVAERFGLDIESLERAPYISLTLGGIVRPHILWDIVIMFSTVNGEPHIESLKSVDVVSQREAEFHGLLGMDILDRFRWRKGRGFWFLEK
jgi:hypothetical protein